MRQFKAVDLQLLMVFMRLTSTQHGTNFGLKKSVLHTGHLNRQKFCRIRNTMFLFRCGHCIVVSAVVNIVMKMLQFSAFRSCSEKRLNVDRC